jgi:hypothetical protein
MPRPTTPTGPTTSLVTPNRPARARLRFAAVKPSQATPTTRPQLLSRRPLINRLSASRQAFLSLSDYPAPAMAGPDPPETTSRGTSWRRWPTPTRHDFLCHPSGCTARSKPTTCRHPYHHPPCRNRQSYLCPFNPCQPDWPTCCSPPFRRLPASNPAKSSRLHYST